MKLRPCPVEAVHAALSVVLLIAVGLTAAGLQQSGQISEPEPFGDRLAVIGPSLQPSATAIQTINTARPTKLAIPALGIKARIIAVGVDAQRNVEVPEAIEDVGWYRYGVTPGSDAGSAVLVAHRDGRIGGAGVFYDLGRLRRNDHIMVTDSRGHRHEYRVVAREVVSKTRFAVQAEDFFQRSGLHRLTLITCGGTYERSAGGYQSNVIVTALPVTGQPGPGSR